MLRSDPRFWKHKVRVSETTYDQRVCYIAEWNAIGNDDLYWRMVKNGGAPMLFPSLEGAREAAIKAYDTDMDVALRTMKKVWP